MTDRQFSPRTEPAEVGGDQCADRRALSTLADGARLTFDVPLVAGVSVAGIALLRKAPFVVVVILAAAVAAGLRAFSALGFIGGGLGGGPRRFPISAAGGGSRRSR